MECIVETIDNARIYINKGQTLILNDGTEITYNDILTWICNRTLELHGLKSVTLRESNLNNTTNLVMHLRGINNV